MMICKDRLGTDAKEMANAKQERERKRRETDALC
jgi:hypothetical protein